MAKKSKKKGAKAKTKNITSYVFDGTPVNEMKTGRAVGSGSGFHEPSIDTGQASSSSPNVSVTLNSVDTISGEETSSVAAHGGKENFGASRPLLTTNRAIASPLTNSSNRSPEEGILLNKVQVGEKVSIPAEGYPSLEDDWGFCLVGCFTGQFPGIKAIEDLLSSWHAQCKFLPHERGWVLFQFPSDEDRRIVLQNETYTLFGKTLLLRILPQDFRFNFDAFMTVDVWVKFVNVPLRCWNKIALEHLGSRVGTPKRTDQGTKQRGRISYCRMLIGVDMSKELPTSFEVSLPDGGEYIQKVVYEGLLKYCFHCKKFGHNLFYCRVLRALRLRKTVDFDNKHAKMDKQRVEGSKHANSVDQRTNKPREARAESTEPNDEKSARPKSTSQPKRPNSNANPLSAAVRDVEETPPAPLPNPWKRGMLLMLTVRRRRRRKRRKVQHLMELGLVAYRAAGLLRRLWLLGRKLGQA